MKVCIIGDGLTSLTLAKTLVNQGIYVDIFSDLKNQNKNQNKNRTIGVSKSNIDFFNKNILNINKLLWNINKIEIYSQSLNNKKILNFEKNDEQLFAIIKNYELLRNLESALRESKFSNFKKKKFNYELLGRNYKLVFNCDTNSPIFKKYFYKKIEKDYKSYAHTTIINHKKFLNNNIAFQIFTDNGPIAFLPISKLQTSVVYSSKEKKTIDLKKYIRMYNKNYTITKINKSINFRLKSSNLRIYRYKNILAFGDSLHKLHPLAGQGFNMTIRDINEILRLIRSKVKLGLDLDESIFLDFEKNIKHKNYIFSNGVDFVYEFFNLESKMKAKFFSQTVKVLGKNKFFNKFFTNFADRGILN